jgi:hypothetical protein
MLTSHVVLDSRATDYGSHLLSMSAHIDDLFHSDYHCRETPNEDAKVLPVLCPIPIFSILGASRNL